MKLVVGLGNPGSRYASTRHNVGRRVVETVAHLSQALWKRSPSLQAEWAEASEEEIPFLLALPNCFMNQSGGPIRRLIEHFNLNFKTDLLVVVDDVALPLGRLRLRASGQDGGHLGLRSIETALGSQSYARLRVGIASTELIEEPLEEYVLRRFSREEEKALKEILDRAAESCRLWLTAPLARAMDWTNRPS